MGQVLNEPFLGSIEETLAGLIQAENQSLSKKIAALLEKQHAMCEILIEIIQTSAFKVNKIN